jgi:hypothetical protein
VSIESSSEHLLWSPPGGIARVAITHKVVSDLRFEVMRGFGVTKRRGTEAGGLLLGRTADQIEAQILVESFETIPCSYSEGPSYHLSEEDYAVFAEALSKHAARSLPVGFWRSSTRETLELDEADLVLMARFFTGPLQIALIVRPFISRTPEAKMFLFGAGRLVHGVSTEDFPFDPVALPATSAVPPRRSHDFAPAPPRPELHPATEPVVHAPAVADLQVPHLPVSAPATPETERILADARRPNAQRGDQVETRPEPELFSSYSARPEGGEWSIRRVLSLLAFAAAMLGLGALAGFQIAGGNAALAGSAAAGQSSPPPSMLNLSAATQDGDLEIRWNHQADVLKAASRGVFYITEAGATKDVALSRGELLNGLLLYARRSGEVQLQLELQLDGSRRISETVVWQGAPPVSAEAASTKAGTGN